MQEQLSIKEQLPFVPRESGVYIWKDREGQVLYVGKARDLRARMRQYVGLQDSRAMVPRLMAEAASFDYIVVQNEHESLILEKNLIQQFKPPFNVDYRDDKSYPFIALTMGEKYPALKYTREKQVASTRYFGPFTDARAARTMIEVARRVTPICLESCAEYRRLCRQAGSPASAPPGPGQACFNYHVGLGPGPCAGAITPEAYLGLVSKVARFLSGERREFIAELDDEMAEAAAELDFERAARARDRINTIGSLESRQHVQLASELNADVIGLFREETIAGIQVLSVREGIVHLANEFILNKGLDVGDEELLRGFILRYYEEASAVPRLVILAELPEDSALIEDWLSERRAQALAQAKSAHVRLQVPQRGERHELLLLATNNAHHALNRYKVRSRYDDERSNLALLQLESALALPAPPLRIECFDISTIHGRYSVASMVVFSGGRPDKGQYRRFKIRLESAEANDVAMMREVLARRYAPERMSDQRFGKRPDLLIVDGGRPQLNVALEELGKLGLDIPVAGLAKADEELFTQWGGRDPVVLPTGSAALYLVKQVRDEAHRFAITYHRQIRGKGMTKSLLDEVAGLGPKRQKLLLAHFGSLKKLRAASAAEIAAVPGIPTALAQEVWAFLDARPSK